MFVFYDDKDISNPNLKLRFHAKFLAFVFSIGILTMFLVAYLSIKGLKSDFDNNFPESLQEAKLLNDFQSQYTNEIIESLQATDSVTNHQKSIKLWNLYKEATISERKGNMAFLFLHEIYQRIFLTTQTKELQGLKEQKEKLVNRLNIMLDSIESNYPKETKESRHTERSEVSKTSQTLQNIESAKLDSKNIQENSTLEQIPPHPPRKGGGESILPSAKEEREINQDFTKSQIDTSPFSKAQHDKNMVDSTHLQNLDSKNVTLLNNLQNINLLSTKIMNIQTKIYMLEKECTDNFHTATLGMLLCVTLLVFGIVFSLSSVVIEFIQRLNAYLKKLFDNATRELSLLNAHLQDEVNRQIVMIQQKDKLLYTQSKLASMGEMIQNIAHQWRQPLNSLMLVIQGIKLKYDKGNLSKEALEKQTKLALNIAQNMSSTIDNFRNFFRLEGENKEFDVKEAITQAIALNKPIFDTLNIKINFNVTQSNDDLLDSKNSVTKSSNHRIYGNKNALMQVLLVLFSNSKDAFLEKDSIESKCCFIELQRGENSDNSEILIKYYDNAGGIESSVIDKIFEPYFTTKHKSSGTGVGLYMARELILNHLKGEIMVENYEFLLNKNTLDNTKDSTKLPKAMQKGALFSLRLNINA